jgi:hypothetical protein
MTMQQPSTPSLDAGAGFPPAPPSPSLCAQDGASHSRGQRNIGAAREQVGIVVTTEGELPDLDVIAASIPEAQLFVLLSARGVARVRNQHGLELVLRFDMDQESLVAELADAGEATDGDSDDAPQYLYEFPMFGRLDVQLPEGFIDVSWHKNTCPSFELPSADKTAEWPLLTLFIDYKDQDQRECDDAPRFFLYAGSDLENWLVATEDWSQVQQWIAAKRAELGMALPASASPNALVRN